MNCLLLIAIAADDDQGESYDEWESHFLAER